MLLARICTLGVLASALRLVVAFTGNATLYLPAATTACGMNVGEDDIVAAVPISHYANGTNCGKFIVVNFQDKSVVVAIQDRCPPCEGDDLNLSGPTFKALAAANLGIIEVAWDFSSVVVSSSSSATRAAVTSSSSEISVPTTSPTSTQSVNVGPIVGGVVGGVAGLVILAIVAFLIRRRMRRNRTHNGADMSTLGMSQTTPYTVYDPPPFADETGHSGNDTSPLQTSATANHRADDLKSQRRLERQRYLRQQMQQIEREISTLQNGNDSEAQRPDMQSMQVQLQEANSQIAYLQNQLNSSWAQGFTDEAPPGYESLSERFESPPEAGSPSRPVVHLRAEGMPVEAHNQKPAPS